MKIVLKRSLARALAATLLVGVFGNALAQNGESSAIKLSDAELDGITAGQGAMSEVLLFNPGNANVDVKTGNHHTCINCVPYEGPRSAGLMNVMTPKEKIVSNIIVQRPVFQ